MTQSPRPTPGSFPTMRLRRLRYNPSVRRLVQETHLAPANFVLPLFVRPGKNVRAPIGSMPGHFQLSVDQVVGEVQEAGELGLGGVMIGIYFTGSKVKVDGPRGEYIHGRQRGPLSEIASVEVRGPSLVATKKSGGEVRLLRTLARKGKASPQLATAAERIRAYLG